MYLGAERAKTSPCAPEICDGWLALFFAPRAPGPLHELACTRGLPARARAARAEDFEVAATVPLIVSDDIDAAADALRPFYALYFGGIAAKGGTPRQCGDQNGL